MFGLSYVDDLILCRELEDYVMMIGRLIEICWRGPNVSEDKSKIVALREEEGSMGEVSVHRKHRLRGERWWLKLGGLDARN